VHIRIDVVGATVLSILKRNFSLFACGLISNKLHSFVGNRSCAYIRKHYLIPRTLWLLLQNINGVYFLWAHIQ